MKNFKRALYVLLALLAGATFIALAFSLNILREEGIEGAWNWKKNIMKKVHPAASPVIDEGEKTVRRGFGFQPKRPNETHPVHETSEKPKGGQN